MRLSANYSHPTFSIIVCSIATLKIVPVPLEINQTIQIKNQTSCILGCYGNSMLSGLLCLVETICVEVWILSFFLTSQYVQSTFCIML